MAFQDTRPGSGRNNLLSPDGLYSRHFLENPSRLMASLLRCRSFFASDSSKSPGLVLAPMVDI